MESLRSVLWSWNFCRNCKTSLEYGDFWLRKNFSVVVWSWEKFGCTLLANLLEADADRERGLERGRDEDFSFQRTVNFQSWITKKNNSHCFWRKICTEIYSFFVWYKIQCILNPIEFDWKWNLYHDNDTENEIFSGDRRKLKVIYTESSAMENIVFLNLSDSVSFNYYVKKSLQGRMKVVHLGQNDFGML